MVDFCSSSALYISDGELMEIGQLLVVDFCSSSALSISDGERLDSGWWTSFPHLLSLFQMVNGWTVVGGGVLFLFFSLHCLMKFGPAVKEVKFK